MSLISRFEEEVIGRFRYTAVGGRTLSYAEYLTLSPEQRSGDEASVVDELVTPRILSWLGYEPGADYTYNDPRSGQNHYRPDFVIHEARTVLFIWEDKNTVEEFGPSSIPQLQRYTAGTQGYAVWCNGRQLILLRFEPQGGYRVLLVVDVYGIWGSSQQSLFGRDNLELFHRMLCKERFTSFDGMVDEICIDESEWHPIPLSSDDGLIRFIDGSRAVLDDMGIAARAQAQLALEGLERQRQTERGLRAQVLRANDLYLRSLLLSPAKKIEYQECLGRLVDRLGQWDPAELDTLYPDAAGVSARTAYSVWRKQVEAVEILHREAVLEGTRNLEIHEAFGVWRSRQPDSDKATIRVFSEQVAYVFFIRLMLARILEDKHILPSRIISDGGFSAWRNLVRTYFSGRQSNIYGSSLTAMLFRNVSTYYQHFFQQPIFDWFVPDDFLLVSILRHLSRYSFSEISSDVLGFTYENYIDRAKRNKKGHFLTRPELVEFMLDQTRYSGNEIIGRKVLDPACGSGSFLIHCARRLRQALRQTLVVSEENIEHDPTNGVSEIRAEFAIRYINQAQTLLYGMEIDPFACYLSELNLFVQVLDDLNCLWRAGQPVTIQRFNIYCTDSLDLPIAVLQGVGLGFVDDGQLLQGIDEAYPIKAKSEPHQSGFMYIISNPPYITSKRQELRHRFQDIAFYREALSGDSNTYLLFTRLGQYYAAPGGVLAFVVPLTLIGDDSAEAVRRLLSTGEWHIRALTRFYAELVLFPGVDQHVCVFVAEHSSTPEEGHSVAIAGGSDVASARETIVHVAIHQVVNNVPVLSPEVGARWPGQTSLRFPWIGVTDLRAYDLWERIRDRCSHTVGMLAMDVVEARQGDVNSTHLNPQRVGTPEEGSIPVFSGRHVQPFAPLSSPDQWATPVPETRLNANQDRAWRELCRIAGLGQRESGFVLQEIVNIPIHCRIRGTWFERSRENPFVFTHQVWRFLARPEQEERAMALFGVVTSHLLCYIYGLFSTNSHMLLSLLYRLPSPDPASMPTTTLAELVRQALASRNKVARGFAQLGARFTSRGSKRIDVDPLRLIRASRVSTITLRDALDRGLIRLPNNLRLHTALQHAEFNEAGSPFEQASRIILVARGGERVGEVLQQELPEPIHSGSWLAMFEEKKNAIQEEYDRFLGYLSSIDDEVFCWYGVHNRDLREMVAVGLPWEYGNRSIHEEETNSDEA